MKLNEVLLNARNTLQSVKLHAGRGGLGEAHLDIYHYILYIYIYIYIERERERERLTPCSLSGLLLSVRSKPFAVRMFAEGLTWQLFTPFALRRLKSRHKKYKSRHHKIIKHDKKS